MLVELPNMAKLIPEDYEKMKNQDTTRQAIRDTCNEIATLLLEKNAAYGNSALEPVRIFSKATPVEQILVRLDDKLSRLARGSAAGEDVILDLIGYLVLLRIATKEDNLYCPTNRSRKSENQHFCPQRVITIMQKHRYSIETLYHFSCDCGKWWSVGDYQSPSNTAITCPHCGTKAPTEPLTSTACSHIYKPNGDFIEEEIVDSCNSGAIGFLTDDEVVDLLDLPKKAEKERVVNPKKKYSAFWPPARTAKDLKRRECNPKRGRGSCIRSRKSD